MTSLERILAAMQGIETDRRAFTLITSLYGGRLTGVSPHDYFHDPERYLAGQKAVYELSGQDILFSPFCFAREAEAYGGQAHWFPDGPPNIKKPGIPNARVFLDRPMPDSTTSAPHTFITETIRLVSKEFSGRVPVCAVMVSPAEIPVLAMGLDAWIETLITDPETASRVLDRCARWFSARANELLAAGAAFIASPMEFINPAILFPRLIDELVLPALRTALAEIRGPVVLHHGGNPVNAHLETWATLPGVAGFALDNRDSIPEARSTVGESPLLLGNLSAAALPFLDIPTVRKLCLNMLETNRADPRWILCTAGADVPWNTGEQTISTIGHTVREFGGAQ